MDTTSQTSPAPATPASDGYHVTYRATEDSDEGDRNSLDAAEREGLDLATVVETCRACHAEADLFDAAGSRKGRVHADGSYTLS